MAFVRVALVSPYSYTYPGGVGRHVEALAEELTRQGHEIRLLAPYDPDDRLARVAHRGARPQPRPLPDYFVPLGRTMGFPMNGAVSNLARVPGDRRGAGPRAAPRRIRPGARARAERAVRVLVRDRGRAGAGRGHLPHLLDQPARQPLRRELHRRPAAVREAERADRGLGGRAVDGAALLRRPLPDRPQRRGPVRRPARRLAPERVAPASSSSAAPRSARACPCCCAPSRRCAAWASRPGSPSRARPPTRWSRCCSTREGIDLVGQVDDAEKWRLLGEADLLSAPSLGGESFGMVLTEAFASGTPVVASDIAGYRDVVRDGRDGVLVPAGDAVALGETLLELASDPARRSEMAEAARERAERFAWPNVAREVESTSTRRRSAFPSRRAAWRGVARRAGVGSHRARAARRAPSACPRSSRGARRPAAAAWLAPRGAWSWLPASSPAPGSPRWRSSGSASSRSAARSWPPPRSGCWWRSR